MKKILAIMVCFILMFTLNFVNAETYVARDGVSANTIKYPKEPDVITNNTVAGVTDLTDRVWATAITIVQVLAVGCVVFAGLRYMYSSANRRAEIKNGMIYLAIGAIFVFATTTVIKFIYSAGSSLL